MKPTIITIVIAAISMTLTRAELPSFTDRDQFGFDVFGVDANGIHKSAYPGYCPLRDCADPYSIHNMLVNAGKLDPYAKIGANTAFKLQIEILRLRGLGVPATNQGILASIDETWSRRYAACNGRRTVTSPVYDAFGVDQFGRHKSHEPDYNPLADPADKYSIYNYLISFPHLEPETLIGPHSATAVLQATLRLAAKNGEAPRNEGILKILIAQPAVAKD